MQLKSNLNHVFTSFSTKPPNNYRIFCGNKQIQSKYIYRFYDIIISPSHHPQASQKHRHPCAPSNPPKTALSLAMHYILGSLVKGSWLATRLFLIINCNICDFINVNIHLTLSVARLRDCRIKPCHSHNPLKSTATLAPEPTLPKPHYPSKSTITLASLVKGEVLSPEKIRATTGGIAVLPSIARTQLPQHKNPPLE